MTTHNIPQYVLDGLIQQVADSRWHVEAAHVAATAARRGAPALTSRDAQFLIDLAVRHSAEAMATLELVQHRLHEPT